MKILKNLSLAALGACLTLMLTAVSGASVSSWEAADLASAKQKLEARDFAGAEAELKALVEADPKNQEAWVALGKAYFGLRWFEDSEACFKKAIEADALMGEALYYHGVLTLLKGKMFDREAANLFDQAAKIPSPVQDRAEMLKYSMLKYTTIPGRSVSKEFDAWLKAGDKDSWVNQLGTYLRKPVSNQKIKAQANAHKEGAADPVDIDIDANFVIGMKCKHNLYGIAIEHFKTAMTHGRNGDVEWELSRAFFERLGRKLYWDVALGFDYEPNETGALEVKIRDRESFALACGLKNGDEILMLNGMDADFTIVPSRLRRSASGQLARHEGQARRWRARPLDHRRCRQLPPEPGPPPPLGPRRPGRPEQEEDRGRQVETIDPGSISQQLEPGTIVSNFECWTIDPDGSRPIVVDRTLVFGSEWSSPIYS